jgi:opacity protein-like surface antigen
MKIIHRLVLASALALGAATPSFAEEAPSAKTGFYATLGLGAVKTSDVGVTDSDVDAAFGAAVKGEIKIDTGFSGDLGVGYDFGKFRTELTYVRTTGSLDSVTGTSGANSGTLQATSDVSTDSLMVSGYYDFANKSKWTPYVGAGIGYTKLKADPIVGAVTIGGTTYTGTVTEKGNEDLFGYQAKIGVSYAATPALSVYAEGTYQGTGGFTAGTTKYEGLDSFGGKIGVRYYF